MCDSPRPSSQVLTTFRDTLRRGEPAELSYRGAWGGLTQFFLMEALALLVAWALSARTRVTFDRESGSVEAASQIFVFGRWRRLTFEREDIVEVLLSGSRADSETPVYRPAFHLKDGEIVALSKRGIVGVKQAQHRVTQIERLLSDARST